MPTNTEDLYPPGIKDSDVTYIQRRYKEATWYAFGWEDATKKTVDVFGFAQYAARQARDYRMEKVSHLASVQDQFQTFTQAN